MYTLIFLNLAPGAFRIWICILFTVRLQMRCGELYCVTASTRHICSGGDRWERRRPGLNASSLDEIWRLKRHTDRSPNSLRGDSWASVPNMTRVTSVSWRNGRKTLSWARVSWLPRSLLCRMWNYCVTLTSHSFMVAFFCFSHRAESLQEVM